MLKRIAFGIFTFVCIVSSAFATETIFIEIGSDRTVSSGSTVNLVAELGGTCSNMELSTIYWMEQNDKGGWSSQQAGGIGNISYSFTASITKQVKAQIRCPQGSGPLFFSEIIGEDIITITVPPLADPYPVVLAGNNTTYTSGSIVSLSGGISGTPCTVFDYQWEQLSGPSVEIYASGASLINSNFYGDASFIFPDSSEEIKLKLKVTPQSCIHAGNTYSGTVIYTKTQGQTPSNGGGSNSSTSRSLRTLIEAESLFLDSDSINAIDLQLHLAQEKYSPFLNLYWNNIGGEDRISYILEYSTSSKFETYETFETTEMNYNLIDTLLNGESLVHFFRLKAGYMGKYSNYSNVITYYSEDYLPYSCCQKNRTYPIFTDIFLGADFLVDDSYVKTCKKCKVSIE